MSKKVTVLLTAPQASAILSAIGEVTAGEMDGWSVQASDVLFRARDRIEAALDGR